MARCKSGQHEWLDPADAAKCCNGWRRVLLVGNLAEAERVVFGDVAPYGFYWAKAEAAPALLLGQPQKDRG